LLPPLPPLRGPPTFAELYQSAETDVDELQLLPPPRTPRPRPSRPSSRANVTPDHRMDVDVSPPPPQQQQTVANLESPALDPSVSTETTTNGLAGVIEQMQKQHAAERLLWRNDIGDIRAMYESRIRELEEHHQQLRMERDSREKLLMSELEELRTRLARSDERIDTVIQTYLSAAITPLSSPSRACAPPHPSSTGATVSRPETPLGPRVLKPLSVASFAPPPLFAPAPSANTAPKTPQEPHVSSDSTDPSTSGQSGRS
jgi:hypothetical protein